MRKNILAIAVPLLAWTCALVINLTGCANSDTAKSTTPVIMQPQANQDEFAVRNPAAQGFYPGAAADLELMVKDLFSKTSIVASAEVVAICTPHAGYAFSGMVAATAFRYASNREIKTVILLGPSHHFAFPGFSIWPRGKWVMPGFELAVDADFAKLLLDNSVVTASIEPQLPEHSLEVQLPFIHELWPAAGIVPIVAGVVSDEQAQALEKSLIKAVGTRNDVLLVATCDLSHYHPRTQAQKLDDKAVELMASFNSRKLLEADASHQIEIDAPEVVMLTQEYARDMGAHTAKVLMRRDSGDATGDTSAVVGYGSFAYEK